MTLQEEFTDGTTATGSAGAPPPAAAPVLDFHAPDIPALLDEPDFQKTPQEERAALLDRALSVVYQNDVADNPDPEAHTAFHNIARKAQERITPGLAERTARGVGGAATGVVRGTAALGAVQTMLNPVVSTFTGRGMKAAGEAMGAQARGYAESARQLGREKLTTRGHMLELELDHLKQAIDGGLMGQGGTAFKDRHTAIQKALADYHGDPAYATAHGLTAPENAAALGAYITTRSPAAWDALRSSLMTTREKAAVNARLQELGKDNLGRMILEGSDPLNVLMTVVPALRGVKAATTTATALTRAAAVGKSAATGAALGAVAKLNQDPSAPLSQVAQSALEMGLTAGALHAGTEGAARLLKGRTTEPPPVPQAETAPAPSDISQSASESAAVPPPGVMSPGKAPAATEPPAAVTTPPGEAGSSPAAGAIPDADAPQLSLAPAPLPPSQNGPPLGPSNMPPVPNIALKGQREIIRDLAEGLNVPVRFGRLRHRAGGYFVPRANLITSAKANDVPVVAHEVGHKLDQLLRLRGQPAFTAELMHLGDSARAGSRSSWTPSKGMDYRRGEGVAEFVRYWLTDPAQANALAPRFAAYFDALLVNHTDLSSVLHAARENIRLWRNAQPEARLDSSIVIGGNPNKTRYGLPELTRDLVDDLHVLRLAVDDAQALRGQALPPSQNPYLLARLLRGSYGMADTFLRHGIVDYRTRAVQPGTSLEAALKPVAGRMNEFRRYVVARRATELHAQGRETGLVPSDVAFVMQKYGADPVFQKAFADLQHWQSALLKYAVDAGYLSQDSAAAMQRMNQDYVPFHRMFEVGAGESPTQGAGGTGRGLNVGSVGSMRRMKGSTRDIVDPLETIVRNAYAIITASEKSAINSAIAQLADSPGMGHWVERIGTPKEQLRVPLERVRQQLEAAGADLTGVPDDLLMEFWRQRNKAPFGENIIKVTTAGEPAFYRLKRELHDTIHALEHEDAGTLLSIASAPAQWLRAGVTLDPAFGLANLIRDAFGSAIINRHGLLPFEASLKGLGALIRNPKLVAEWAASGGANSIEPAFFDAARTADYLRKSITKSFTPAERALMVLRSPLDALRKLSETIEEATRIGEYQASYNANIKDGMTPGDARRLAAFESRDRQDFSKGGAKTKALRRIAAFWNAALQGNVKLYQSFKNRPLRSTLQGAAFVTVPTLAIMAMNWDDPDYWDRPQWERDGFWLIPAGKDANNSTRFVRIPKPFLPGAIFGTLPERFLQWAKTRDPAAVTSALKSITQETVPNPMPQTATTVFETFLSGPKGWDIFRGRQIVPESIADLPPEQQWTEQTTQTARAIGKLVGLPPVKVDHIISSTTGGLGKQIVRNITDRMLGGAPVPASQSNPAARFLAVPAGISSQALTEFYQQLNDLRTARAGAKNTKIPMPSADLGKLHRMESVNQRLSKLRALARAETDETKKQAIYIEMRDLAAPLVSRQVEDSGK